MLIKIQKCTIIIKTNKDMEHTTAKSGVKVNSNHLNSFLENANHTIKIYIFKVEPKISYSHLESYTSNIYAYTLSVFFTYNLGCYVCVQ